MLADLRELTERLLAFESTPGNEAPVQAFVRDALDDLGFETYEWTADPERLAEHPSFPDDPAAIDCADRPSVGGVAEFDRDGPTLVLNGHVDVVPASDASGDRERSDGIPASDADGNRGRSDGHGEWSAPLPTGESSGEGAPPSGSWSSDPFEPSWSADGERLTARGAADMKSGLAACIVAAHRAADEDLAGRVVVESVAGEEEGGIGAAAAALDNPYPFERDAAIIAEPTDLRPVVACEGSLMGRLSLRGRSAHAATSWRGESVLPRFEHVRRALEAFERERGERVTHPLYEGFPVPWPVVVGTVRAGEWASTVPSELTAEVRVGVAPGETVDEVEAALRERLAAVAAESGDDWLAAHPPAFERFSVQFEASEVAPDEPVVGAVQSGMRANGLDATDPLGATYGADARHYIGAGVPTVLFGPGTIEQAHFPDETVRWRDVERAADVLSDAVRTYLSGHSATP